MVHKESFVMRLMLTSDGEKGGRKLGKYNLRRVEELRGGGAKYRAEKVVVERRKLIRKKYIYGQK